MSNIEIIKIPRTDEDVDNTSYMAKVPYTVSDDFGNTYTLYRREDIVPSVLVSKKNQLLAEIAEIEAKLNIISTL